MTAMGLAPNHQTTPQADFLVCLGQVLADLIDDALVNQELAGFLVLSVDQCMGEFFHRVRFHGLVDKPEEDRRVRLARNAMAMASTKQTSDI